MSLPSIITLPPEKSPSSVVLLHQNPRNCLFKICFICAYFSPDSDEMAFSLEKAILWIMGSLARNNGLKFKEMP